MAKVFQEVFTKPEYNMEDFLDHGYGTVRPDGKTISITISAG